MYARTLLSPLGGSAMLVTKAYPCLRDHRLGFGTVPREGLILPQGRPAASVALDLPYRGANYGRPAGRRILTEDPWPVAPPPLSHPKPIPGPSH